jgi:hypothetical protein
MDIALHHVVTRYFEVFQIASQENAAALARCFRLRNESFAAFGLVFELLSEITVLGGKRLNILFKLRARWSFLASANIPGK